MTVRTVAIFALLILTSCDRRPVAPYDQRCLINCGRPSPTMSDLVGTWRGPDGGELIIEKGNVFRIPVGEPCGFPPRDGVGADGYVHGHFDIKQREGLSTPRDSRVDWWLLIYADPPGVSMGSAAYPSYGPKRIELGRCVLTKVE
ncbi:hypothetical protein [Caulobacter sp. NIBR1757]|uniref:hypothetical protein n=1 Tax=Caulobacter sp. NIBR1757 TaxID=3016000 RepID=UPI0022F0E274|nr:hypothetical protein [Caulobacter sp. NIBR1757]WGM39633.1 hypothetical protein AMEJIAPC_02558 [Caulobacter sp. NIBR1757]